MRYRVPFRSYMRHHKTDQNRTSLLRESRRKIGRIAGRASRANCITIGAI